MSTPTEKEIVIGPDGTKHEVVDFNDDYEGAKLGFWILLFTELMLFGALFLIFSFYFFRFTEDYVTASGTLDLTLGTINTIILLVSTYTMGMSFMSLKQNNIKKSKLMLWVTVLLSIAFLTIKYFEWMHEIHIGIYPDSEILNAKPHGITLFFGLYFTMTGLHGIHIIIGIVAMLVVLKKVKNGSINPKNYIVLENTALYWDLVHLVWVFLFPLFYMIGA